ncbi:MAG: DUF488 domain-containing protein [Gammaproteobacteria bacterium]|nr:DUF488 domain-containing protein [Gammaproteobacteria bacterium]MYF67305.1 DUF488 domain-containing protein [Gammaproteobacteria bacterium]MYK36738.1 DUF488 domain-containing protein [Gammaproteobacteria bacterium]
MTTEAVRSGGIFTVGHSAHEAARFVDLLDMHDIEAVADVRSMPYSRRNPQFNRETLKESLKASGIAYVFLGKELGARSNDPDCYENGRVQFRKLAATSLFRSGIKRVLDGSEQMRIALMCAEKDPLNCHRTILVTRELVALGKKVNHILADGEVETHDAAMNRLCKQLNIGKDLLRTPEELENDAYAAWEAKIAYANPKARARGRPALPWERGRPALPT